MMRALLTAATLAILIAAAPLVFTPGTLTILTGAPRCCLFNVQIAWTEPQRELGLAGQTSLAGNAGMLLEYPKPEKVSITMANVRIPLDILFIGAHGRISDIVANVPPGLSAPLVSPGPVRAVLEIAAGTVAALNIKVGDRVEAPLFGDVPNGAMGMTIGRTRLP